MAYVGAIIIMFMICYIVWCLLTHCLSILCTHDYDYLFLTPLCFFVFDAWVRWYQMLGVDRILEVQDLSTRSTIESIPVGKDIFCMYSAALSRSSGVGKCCILSPLRACRYG